MTESFTIAYDKDSDTKKKSPIAVEGDGAYIVLTIGSDRTTKEFHNVVNLCYNSIFCIVNEGNHWLILKNRSVWESEVNLFFKEQVDGKWIETDKKKAELAVYTNAIESSGGGFAICVDGHPVCMALVKHFNGQWINSEVVTKSKEGEAATKFFTSWGSDTIDIESFNKAFTTSGENVLSVVSSPSELKRNMVGILPHPKYDDTTFIPLIVSQGKLPKLSQPRVTKSESQKTEELLAGVLGLCQVTSFDDLVTLTYTNPTKVLLAFGVHRVSIPLTMDLLEVDIKNYVSKLDKPTE